MKYVGYAHKYGDDVDTDLIVPGEYLSTGDRAIMAAHALEGLDPGFVQRVKPGDVVVGGKNFGCGSARPGARALADAGASCIVACSFARLFLRNAVNQGVPVVECPEAVAGISTGDHLEVDLVGGAITNVTSGQVFSFRPMPPFLQEMVKLGGLVNYARAKFQS